MLKKWTNILKLTVNTGQVVFSGEIYYYWPLKVGKHIEMPKAAPKKSICHFQKLEMILKWNKENTVRLPQKYQFLLIKHEINC